MRNGSGLGERRVQMNLRFLGSAHSGCIRHVRSRIVDSICLGNVGVRTTLQSFGRIWRRFMGRICRRMIGCGNGLEAVRFKMIWRGFRSKRRRIVGYVWRGIGRDVSGFGNVSIRMASGISSGSNQRWVIGCRGGLLPRN
jgi:hypothetical protein